MALIRCPECRQPMSTTLDKCPHCGYELSDNEMEAAIEEAIVSPVRMKEEQKKTVVYDTKEDKGSFGGGFALGFFIGLIGVIVAACVGKKDTKSGALVGFVVQFVGGIILTIIIYSLALSGL